MKIKWVLVTAGILLSIHLSAFTQNTQTPAMTTKPSASVEGHVLCNDSGAPARKAVVRLHLLSRLLPKAPNSPPDRTEEPHEVFTDFNGYYRFPSVAPGVYVLSVKQDGYNDNFSIANSILDHFDLDEQKKILGTFPQVSVAATGALQQDLILHRGAAISGRITLDTGGLPGEVQVTATLLSTALFGDTPEKDAQHFPPNYSTFTSPDDRGFYRIAGLPPGTYQIQAHVTENFFNTGAYGNASLLVYAPEALDASEARAINVAEGEELADADINIPTRLLHSISGTVTQGGAPIEKAVIRIFRQSEKEPCDCGTVTNADGNYRIDLLRSGTYALEFSIPSRASRRLPAKAFKLTLAVDNNDVTGANIEIPITQQNQ